MVPFFSYGKECIAGEWQWRYSDGDKGYAPYNSEESVLQGGQVDYQME